MAGMRELRMAKWALCCKTVSTQTTQMEPRPMSAFDLLPLFLPAAMVGSAIGAQSLGAAILRSVNYRQRGGLRFASVGRLSVSWSVRRKGV